VHANLAEQADATQAHAEARAEARDLAAALAAGDPDAWARTVERHRRLVWSIARAHGLTQEQAEDVSQVTWLRLVQHLGSLRQPERLGQWLAVTTRRESLRVRRLARRHTLTGDPATFDRPDQQARPPDERILASERDRALWQAFETLPDRCRKLLRLLLVEPAPAYTEIAAALNRPIGSIGPTRARCLACLRKRLDRSTL
jgi:RNA polymerase sigma factor (sigma-70 family)